MLISKRYYVGVVRAQQNDTKAQTMRRYQQQLLARLENEEWHISRGFLMQTDGRYHEKGVDVKIATDLLVGAYEDSYDTAVIVSSDTDMIPAIQKVRDLGKGVEYIGFSHKPSFAMQKHASISRLIIRDELEPFVYQNVA